MIKNNVFLFFSIFLIKVLIVNLYAQNKYKIDATLDENKQTVTVSQTINFVNTTQGPIEKIYLNDWANAYEGTESQLVKHLANQFNRSFYFSSKNKLGFSKIDEIRNKENKLQWSYFDQQLDIIELNLGKPLIKGGEIIIYLKYKIKIPDDKFTGFGIGLNNKILFRDFFLSISPYIGGRWILNSNLGLRDNSHVPSEYEVKWKYGKDYFLESNLVNIKSDTLNKDINTSKWVSNALSSPEFVFEKENRFQTITLDDEFKITTDILPRKNSDVDINESIKKIYNFTNQILGKPSQEKILILKKDYSKNPIVGITEALSFLKPFSDAFIYETKFIKAYLASYLHENLIINKRKKHWIPGGMQTYVMMKYIEAYYPDSKFLGALKDFKLLGIRPFNGYSASNIGFNESFSFIYEFGEHANNQQSDTLGREKLTKSNELYTSPYHVGSGFYYLDQFLGNETVSKSLKYFSEKKGKDSLKSILEKNSNVNLDWFFKNYISDREAFDLSIKNVIKNKKTVFFTISEKNNKEVPFKLDLIKDDNIVKEDWYFHSGKDSVYKIKRDDFDFVAINSNKYLPEKIDIIIGNI